MRVESGSHEWLVGWFDHILEKYGLANLVIGMVKPSFKIYLTKKNHELRFSVHER